MTRYPPPPPYDYSLPPSVWYPMPDYLYLQDVADANRCLESVVPGDVVALDLEWVGTQPSGRTPREKEVIRRQEASDINFTIDWATVLTGLIQVATKDRPVFIIDVTVMRVLPVQLIRICIDPRIPKVAPGIMNDCIRMWKDFRVNVRSAVSLSLYAKLARPLAFNPEDHFKTEPSLASIVAATTNRAVNKSHRNSNWKARPLSLAQLHYAAVDAHSALQAYTVLKAEIDAFDNRDDFKDEWTSFDFVDGRAVNMGDNTPWDAYCPWWSFVQPLGFRLA